MGLGLIPVSDGGDVVREGLEFLVRPPTESLDSYAEVIPETDRVHDVPPIEAMLGYLPRFFPREGITEE